MGIGVSKKQYKSEPISVLQNDAISLKLFSLYTC